MTNKIVKFALSAALGASSITAAIKPVQAQYQTQQYGAGNPFEVPVNVQAQDLGYGRGVAIVQMRDRTLEARYDGLNVHYKTTYKDFRSGGMMVFENDLSRDQRGVYYFARNIDKLANNIASQNPRMQALPPQALGQMAETVTMDMLYLGKRANDAYYQVNRSNPYGAEYGIQFCAIPPGAPLRNLDYFFHSGNQGPAKFPNTGNGNSACDAPRPGFGGGFGSFLPGIRSPF